MKDNMDNLLKEALQPKVEPSEALNASILEKEKQTRKRNTWHGVPKVAVAALVFALLCPVGVYAANLVLKQVQVTEHTMTVGSTEFVDDKVIEEAATAREEVKIENVSHEEGDANVKWLTKDVEKINGVATNTTYTYDDYKAMLADSKLPNWLSKDYELNGTASYTNSKYDTFEEDSMDASFNYGKGQFDLYVSKMVKGFDENTSNSLYLRNTGNKRAYKNAEDTEFTLVDEEKKEDDETITTTYVVIAYDMYYGCIAFNGLTEDEIHHILDSVKIEK